MVSEPAPAGGTGGGEERHGHRCADAGHERHGAGGQRQHARMPMAAICSGALSE